MVVFEYRESASAVSVFVGGLLLLLLRDSREGVMGEEGEVQIPVCLVDLLLSMTSVSEKPRSSWETNERTKIIIIRGG